MKRAGNLYPQIADFEALHGAYRRAFRGANRTEETLRFCFNAEGELLRLRDELVARTYQPGPYRYFQVHLPKERTIAVAPFRDRVVHHAVFAVLEPIYEKIFIHDSYATRKEKGAHRAIRRAQDFMKRNGWYLKADIAKYFDSVDHGVVMAIMSRKIKDRDVLALMERIIRNGGYDGRGLPIGNLTSQFLANVYLDPFDHYVKEVLKEKCYIRYMDDFVVFGNDRAHLKALREKLAEFLEEKLKLRFKEKAVMINQQGHGLGFLGARIFPGLIRIRRENLARCISKVRQREDEYERGKLSETELKQSLTSIAGYLEFFDTCLLRQALFQGWASRARTA